MYLKKKIKKKKPTLCSPGMHERECKNTSKKIKKEKLKYIVKWQKIHR